MDKENNRHMMDNDAPSADHEDIEESEGSEEDEEMEHVDKVINVAFDARPPSDTDFHGIKRLLQQLFVKDINEDLSELANLIVAQDFVGSVLKQDHGEESDDDSDEEMDEDEKEYVYAVHTVVNLSENQSLPCIEGIRSLLSSKCKEFHKKEPSYLSKLFGDASKQVGLLICERFINIPPQVALPSFESLKEDIERAVRKKRKFNFSHLLLVSKTYKTKSGDAMGENIFYSNPEEQLFEDMCEMSFTFSVADQRDSVSGGQWDDDGGDMESLRTVMVFNGGVLAQIVDKLKTEIPATPYTKQQ